MKGLNDYNASLFPPFKTHGSTDEAIYDFQLCKATNTHIFYKYLPKKNMIAELSLLCPHIQMKCFLKGSLSKSLLGQHTYLEQAMPLISVFFFFRLVKAADIQAEGYSTGSQANNHPRITALHLVRTWVLKTLPALYMKIRDSAGPKHVWNSSRHTLHHLLGHSSTYGKEDVLSKYKQAVSTYLSGDGRGQCLRLDVK